MKLSSSELRALIQENIRILLEEKEEKLREDSLDLQVDKYLAEYEKDSKAVKKEGRDLRSMTKSFLQALLLEEDEEKKEEKKEKLTSSDLDLEVFASNVMRLIDNYDSLLEIRETIARRASNYLLKNYDPSVIQEFNLILEEQYDVVVDGQEPVDDSDKYPAPPANRAGAGGVGGA